MIETIELEKYRGFERFKLSNLARVNLLVGKNNSGKSSILEAVHLLASRDVPNVLAKIARQRGEMVSVGEDRESRMDMLPDISHFFHSHAFDQSSSFKIISFNSIIKSTSILFSIQETPSQSPVDDRLIIGNSEFTTPLVLQISGTTIDGYSLSSINSVNEDGSFPTPRNRRMITQGGLISERMPVLFISPDSLQRSLMSELWDKVATEGREDDVVKAMQILDPTLKSIVFLSGERLYRYETRGGILVGFEGIRKRVPLGSYGEGMRRLLAIALSLANTKDGILLIDEIDTGLHYSVMGDMWLLIVEAAMQNNIQVFLTTHSLDCIRGLAWLCRNHPELGNEVSLQKIEPNLKESVSLNADEIQITVDQDFEVR